MDAINFPEANVQLGKDQPQYQTLPVFYDPENNGEMTACFQLSEEEIQEIVRTGKLWYTQLTFGHPFQPVRMSVQNPFVQQP